MFKRLLVLFTVITIGLTFINPLVLPVHAQDSSATSSECTPEPSSVEGFDPNRDTALKDPNCAYDALGSLISLLITIALIGAAITAFVFFIIGAIQWGTAKGGDAAAKARSTMIYAIVGLIIVACVYVFLQIYNNVLPTAPPDSQSCEDPTVCPDPILN